MSFQTLILSRVEIEQKPPSHQQRAVSAGHGNYSPFSAGDEFQLFRFARRAEPIIFKRFWPMRIWRLCFVGKTLQTRLHKLFSKITIYYNEKYQDILSLSETETSVVKS